MNLYLSLKEINLIFPNFKVICILSFVYTLFSNT